MNVSDAFPSSFLKVDDLKGQPHTLTILRVQAEQLGDPNNPEFKPVASFENTKKQLVLNKTNFTTIAEVLGESDTDAWAGKQITLIPARTEYQGKRVPCIRVQDTLPAAAVAAQAPTTTSVSELARDDTPGEPLGAPVLDEDSIPFALVLPLLLPALSLLA